MELADLLVLDPAFAQRKHVEKIKTFAWFVLAQQGRPHFTAADIRRCYEELNLAPPSSVGPFLIDMEKKKPKEALRLGGGFVLEMRVRAAIDAKLGSRPTAVHIDKLLADLPAKVSDEAERAFLDEAYICFKHRAFRAAIVMTWNLAFDHLLLYVVREKLAQFNAQLKTAFPKKSEVRSRTDFAELDEYQILVVCKGAGIITGNQHKILEEKLKRRNMAAHPSREAISQLTAEDFIKDLVENIVLTLPSGTTPAQT